MILYHGSNTDIGKIDLALSKVGKDFGCGFYLSADKEQAWEMAERKAEMLRQADVVVALPGSFGTWDELFDALALRRSKGGHKHPVGILNVNGYFAQPSHRKRKS